MIYQVHTCGRVQAQYLLEFGFIAVITILNIYAHCLVLNMHHSYLWLILMRSNVQYCMGSVFAGRG